MTESANYEPILICVRWLCTVVSIEMLNLAGMHFHYVSLPSWNLGSDWSFQIYHSVMFPVIMHLAELTRGRHNFS